MKNKEKPSTPSAATDGVGKAGLQKPVQSKPRTANELDQGTDRPGFDLGGSTGKTHAGSGLGLGTDAFDTPGDRRLPGRQPDNELTIPRWDGPEHRGTGASGKKTADVKSLSAPETKKIR